MELARQTQAVSEVLRCQGSPKILWTLSVCYPGGSHGEGPWSTQPGATPILVGSRISHERANDTPVVALMSARVPGYNTTLDRRVISRNGDGEPEDQQWVISQIGAPAPLLAGVRVCHVLKAHI